ncbi:LysR family transcriptional regulator [Aminobacter sp. NyZ550]|nr:LysR family transcriptional regulator [Aminobacter sp. NyZ550]WAX96253.1 LysR family transcriptional regulator [Aminobacter sp. NyZ550]
MVAISKRIGELEARFSTPLFHRTGRKPVLTTKGEEIRAIAEQILRLNDRLNSLAKKSSVPSFRFRLGVTDLVALSWLPELLSGILDRYPMITLEPEIDLTASLLERLVDRRLDFVICPRVIQEPQFVSTPLGAIELVWMCSPKLLDGKDNATLSDLTKHPLLIQTTGSILRPLLHSVIDNPNLPFKRTIPATTWWRWLTWRPMAWASPSCRTPSSGTWSPMAGCASCAPRWSCPISNTSPPSGTITMCSSVRKSRP